MLLPPLQARRHTWPSGCPRYTACALPRGTHTPAGRAGQGIRRTQRFGPRDHLQRSAAREGRLLTMCMWMLPARERRAWQPRSPTPTPPEPALVGPLVRLLLPHWGTSIGEAGAACLGRPAACKVEGAVHGEGVDPDAHTRHTRSGQVRARQACLHPTPALAVGEARSSAGLSGCLAACSLAQPQSSALPCSPPFSSQQRPACLLQ